MNILDLWSGTGSGTKAWRYSTQKNIKHKIITVDIDKQFNPTICKDILDVTVEELQKYGPFDFIWASPDCTVFSIANLHSRHFYYDEGHLIINTNKARESIKRVKHTLKLIKALNPTFWILENPRGMMRKMPFMVGYDRKTVTYCQYHGNQKRMKPTDLFGVFPVSFEPRMCKNGDPCHTPSPRGSETGTQGLSKIDRSKIQIGLSHEIMASVVDGRRLMTLEDFI